ncbi:nitroreductase family protein [Rhodococcus opacus]|uniref:nitroreductase family protein n=1 Tax=Rhodococcus opacus TaxID=37919 RepID=UPI00294A0564|nr:nitroreductase family protein [Rhodococcus opacus]MDV6244878.1 nitroreductase family protein [Rhodococcus opacus]
MEFKQVVGDRRAIRFFKPYQPVEKEKIQVILEAARLQCAQANIHQLRKAVVLTRGETPDDVFDGIVNALHNQTMAQLAPVIIVWSVDMSAWENMREGLMELIEVGALNSVQGWTEQKVDEGVLKTPEFNVLMGDRHFGEWLSAIEAGLGIGSAVLAAVDEGLGSVLASGDRDAMRPILGMPDHVTPAQLQLVGYPAEDAKAGGQRPRAPFESLFFEHRWGNPLARDEGVVEKLTREGMIQTPAPMPWRKEEIASLARTFDMSDKTMVKE